jgi:hypothetical protein
VIIAGSERFHASHLLSADAGVVAVALPRMLESIEAELATAGPAKTRRLRQRAELIRGLLTPSGSPTPS